MDAAELEAALARALDAARPDTAVDIAVDSPSQVTVSRGSRDLIGAIAFVHGWLLEPLGPRRRGSQRFGHPPPVPRRNSVDSPRRPSIGPFRPPPRKPEFVATSFNKNDKSSRRAVADDVRRKQSRAERRKTFSIVGACVAVAVLIIGAAAYEPIKNWWDLRQFRGVDLAAIGAPASACGKITTKDATEAQQHVPDGTKIVYGEAPPAFGEHYNEPDGMERKLYTEDDRPALGNLVHNLEHGYTILWYDESVADNGDQMDSCAGSPTSSRAPATCA